MLGLDMWMKAAAPVVAANDNSIQLEDGTQILLEDGTTTLDTEV